MHAIKMWSSVIIWIGIATGVSGQSSPSYNVLTAQPLAAQSLTTQSAAAQPTHLVTLELTKVSIADAVHQVIAQTGLALSWSQTKVPLKGTVTLSLRNVPVTEALRRILQGTGAVAKMWSDGETIMIVHAERTTTTESHGATGVVMGRVIDSVSGRGLEGATVRVQGSKLAAVTTDSGYFTLRDVPVGDQMLTVRLFGHRSVTRPVTVTENTQITVRIVMSLVPTILSGMVTTATGTQRKLEVGNDITTLNVDSIMQTAPISSVTDLLESRVPGLTVLHSSGAPGDPSRLRLRGAGSIVLNNDPIVIVDGIRVYSNQSDPRNANLAQSVENPGKQFGSLNNNLPQSVAKYNAPSPIDQIDPSSIETIEVFKGPSASALYGSDAASGVIVITTKHGHAGPTKWVLNLGQGVNWLPGKWPTNYYRFGTPALYDIQPICSWNDVGCHVDSIVAFQALNDPKYSVFSHGSDQTGDLSISGGVPTLLYHVSGSGAGNVGNLKLPAIEQQRYDSAYGPVPRWMIRPDNYTTWGVNGSLTALPAQTLNVTLTASVFNSDQQHSSLEGAISQLGGQYISAGNLYNGSSFSPGPLIQNDVERATDQQLTSTYALALRWQPKEWLPITATGGLNTIQRTDATYIPYGVNYGGPGVNDGDTSGSYGLGRGVTRVQTLNVGTNTPVLRRLVMLAVGANVYDASVADVMAYTSQLGPGISTPTSFPTSGCNNCSSFNQSTSAAATYGWYVEPRLNVNSQFFAAPGFRLDGGSGGNGGSNTGRSTGGLSVFPKLDLSYLAVDKENGRPLWGVLTLLRPRATIGYAGVQPPPQSRLRLFNVGTYTLPVPGASSLALGDGSCLGVCLSSIGNTQLRPERSGEFEGGFDASLWGNRLSLTYTQYQKVQHDAIIAIPVAPSVSGVDIGSGNYEKNIGVIRNTGMSMTVDAFLLQSQALSWSVGGKFSNNNSLVVSLNKGQAPLYDLGVVAGYPLFGVWQRPISSFADLNHDGVIEANEVVVGDSLVFVGQQEPKYQADFTSDIVLLNGRLGIHGTFSYMNGLLQTNNGALSSSAFALIPNAPNTPLATQAAIIAAECGSNSLYDLYTIPCGQSTQIGLMQTVNTFRFNDISINYELPRAVSSWFRVPYISVALQGSNLALHTNYRGKDPNVNAFSTVSAGDETADLGEIPQPRTWWLKFELRN